MKSAGIATGIAIGLIIVVVIMKFINKDGKFKTSYDERQKVIRGNAYKYGFYAMMIVLALELVIGTSITNIHNLGITEYFMPILVGAVIQVSYSIFNDGYEGLNTNMTKYVVVMVVVAGINFLGGTASIMESGLFINGLLNDSFINIMCGILCLIVFVELLVKRAIDNRN